MCALWIALLVCCASPLAAQEFTTLKGHGGPIMDIAVNMDGQVATASFDNSVGLWTGRVPQWLDGHAAAVTTLAYWSEVSLVSGGDDLSVRFWPGVSVSRVLGRHLGKVTDLAISQEAQLVASASWDGTIGLWPLSNEWGPAMYPPLDAPRGRFLSAPGGVNAVAFDGPSRLYAGTSTGVLLLFDLATDSAPLPLVSHGFGINVVLTNGDWIAYGAVDGGTRVIQPDTGAQIADLTLDRRPILALAYHAETAQLAVGDGHGYIMIVDTDRWQIARDFRAMRHGPVWALAFSPDGQTVYAGGLDDVVYAWPVALLDELESPQGSGQRSFLRDPETMPNGERQFMRKCSICHALTAGPSRKAGPTLHGVFGRQAGTLPDYRYSDTLDGSDIIWSETTIDALFDTGPDHYIPGSKMPMQVIARPEDRADLIGFLKSATLGDAK
ncbi:c-type cytochrome [Antarctobacter heliothermus]|nr:c-type cytochrome [Antarctobacter heliothermus]